MGTDRRVRARRDALRKLSESRSWNPTLTVRLAHTREVAVPLFQNEKQLPEKKRLNQYLHDAGCHESQRQWFVIERLLDDITEFAQRENEESSCKSAVQSSELLDSLAKRKEDERYQETMQSFSWQDY